MYVWNIFSLSLADTTLQKNAFQDQTLKADSFNLSPSCLTNTDIFSVKHFGMSFTIPRHFFPRGQNCIQCFFPSYVYTQVMGDTHKGKLISTISWEILGDPLCCFQSRATTVRQQVRERAPLCYQTLGQKKLSSVPGLMDISTWSHEESRKRHRKCLRGCVMPTLITVRVAPALCMLMQWENTGGFCTYSSTWVGVLIMFKKNNLWDALERKWLQ